MLLAQDAPADCRRVRSDPELQACEVERTSHDVLNSADRPPASKLGGDAIRFSTQPSLGGRAFIVEAVKADGGSAAVRVFWLSGHPYGGWRKEGSAAFDLSAGAYRRLTTLVDHYLLTYRLPTREENGETMVCTDGPEALTERVRDGKVTTLSGSCPRDEHEAHPNIHIQAAMLSLACPAITRSVPKDRRQRQACARWQKIAARDRRLIRAEAGTRR